MARAKADEMGTGLNVGSSCGLSIVPTVGSSSGTTDVEATLMKFYPSQAAERPMKDFFQLNPPLIWIQRIKELASEQSKGSFSQGLLACS